MRANIDAYWRLMRFDRPIGILLLLWPTWWALLVAGHGRPSVRNFVVFTLGVIVMRAAGCVMNDIADRNFDPHVERTRNRPLASGELQMRHAVAAFLALLTIAFALVLLTNRLTVMLAFAGAALAAFYPFFKRFTHLPQVMLGAAFGWGIPMAFAAETERVPAQAWWLFGINVLWAVIYDTLYAMVDRDDDRAIGVRSTAILFGRRDLALVGALMALMLASLALFGAHYALSWPWFAGLAGAGALFAHQLWRVRNRDRVQCFRAFMNNNWVGFSVFAGLAAHFVLVSR